MTIDKDTNALGQSWTLLEPLPDIMDLMAIAEAARAEVLAHGYRSSDMATAMKTLWGEFWLETYLPPEDPLSRCTWTVTSDMDDGPLTQRCTRRQHGPEVSHWYGLSGLAPEPGDLA